MQKNQENRRHFIGFSPLFYGGDLEQSIHMTVRFVLDHVIDPDQMQTALIQTAQIYPHLKDAFIKVGNETFFETCLAPLPVFIADKPVAPGPGKAEGRTFTVTCHGNVLYITGFHSTFDGGGHTYFVRTLLLQYCRIHFGSEYQIPGIPEADREEHPEFIEDVALYPLGSFERSHGERPTGESSPIPEFSPDDNGRFHYAEIRASSNTFMRACHDQGATPVILLFLLISKAAYELHPEEEGPLTSLLTVDIRKTFGLKTLGPASTAAYLSASREDIESQTLTDTVQALRRVLDSQRTVDYAKTALDEIQKTGFQSGIPFSFISTYMGHMDLGDCEKHVVDFMAYNCTAQTINLFELGGTFRFQVQLGRGTAVYSKMLCQELKALGVEATISKDDMILPEEIRD